MSANPNCHACNGTEIDQAFGGPCSECWIDANRDRMIRDAYRGVGDGAPTRKDGDGTGKGVRKSAPVPAADIDGLDEAELVDWLREQTWSSFAQSLANFYGRKGYLSPKQLASAISMKGKCDAKVAAKAPKAPKVADTDKVQDEGMFEQSGQIYKVVRSKTSGNLYAKVLKDSTFEYAAGAVRNLREQDRMSLEAAKAYGKQTGRCCARTLTNPESIAAGIGPICANGF